MGLQITNVKIDWGDLPHSYEENYDLQLFKGEKVILYMLIEDKPLEKDTNVWTLI